MPNYVADRAEKLHYAATASAVKAIGSVRKFRNNNGAVSKCSAGSFVPKTKPGASSALEEKSASSSQPPKSDAQKSKDASEAKFPNKKSSAGRERKRRKQSPPSNDDDSSGSDESYSTASGNAEGYDQERQKYNEEHQRWQQNPPGDDGGDDPEEPSVGGGGQADGGGGDPPPPPRGGGADQPRGCHRQAGIIDGDPTGNAIVDALTSLAKCFEKPLRPPLPSIPVFRDSCKEYPRFRKDLKSYLKEFYSTAEERVKVMTIRKKCFTKATLAKICHLDTVKEVLAALSETYV